MDEIDTTNLFAVGVSGSGVVVLAPPRQPLSKTQALNLAAYLVVLAGVERDEFEAVRHAIEVA